MAEPIQPIVASVMEATDISTPKTMPRNSRERN
jgi:hypothetical protein